MRSLSPNIALVFFQQNLGLSLSLLTSPVCGRVTLPCTIDPIILCEAYLISLFHCVSFSFVFNRVTAYPPVLAQTVLMNDQNLLPC